MSKYEMLYIINNDASEEAKQAVIDKMESIVTSNGGTVENSLLTLCKIIQLKVIMCL